MVNLILKQLLITTALSAPLVLAPAASARADLASSTENAAVPAAATVPEKDLTVEQRPVAALRPPASDLSVTAWVDHPDNRYRPGDTVTLSVQTNKDAYVTVIDVGTSGKVHVVYPNRFQQDNRVRGGQVVTVPAGGDNFQLKLSGPAGTEVLKVIATTGPVPLFSPQSLAAAGPFQAYKGTAAAAIKDLEVVLRDQATGNSAWAEYTKVIRIDDSPAAAVLPAPVPVAVQGTLPVSPVSPVTPTSDSPNGFRISVAMSKPVYQVGETALVSVSTERDCTMTLIDIGTSGQATVLFPNRFQPNALLKAGQVVQIPGMNDLVDFKVRGPAGVEAVIAVCRTDGQSVNNRPMNFETQAFVPYGDAKLVAKDLALALRQPAGTIAHAATSFLINQ